MLGSRKWNKYFFKWFTIGPQVEQIPQTPRKRLMETRREKRKVVPLNWITRNIINEMAVPTYLHLHYAYLEKFCDHISIMVVAIFATFIFVLYRSWRWQRIIFTGHVLQRYVLYHNDKTIDLLLYIQAIIRCGVPQFENIIIKFILSNIILTIYIFSITIHFDYYCYDGKRKFDQTSRSVHVLLLTVFIGKECAFDDSCWLE